MNKHVFFFDGTNNGSTDEFPTNVLQMFRLLTPIQEGYYFAGPGDETGADGLERLLGLAFGDGLNEIVESALGALNMDYRPDDKIGAIGFSRGAAAARKFCSEISKRGIRGHFPDIEFLGCFDTVYALMPFGPLQQDTFFHDLHVSSKVLQARHAVAIDEKRAAFAPNLMNRRTGIEEMWFKGGHSDIGGGYEEHGLSDIVLDWMIDEAAECGITFDARERTPSQRLIHQETFPLRREERWVGVLENGKRSNHLPDVHKSVSRPS